MNKLEKFIREKRQKKDILFMTHIIAGYPSFEENLKFLQVMDSVGIDLVEIQFPFSEPIADGPVFSLANRLAIEKGVTTNKCFEFLKSIKNKFSFKILMMGYYNTIFKYGDKKFVQALKNNNLEGMIIADLPLEESIQLENICQKQELSLIKFITPTHNEERIEKIKQSSQGFIYIVVRRGVTGEKSHLNKKTDKLIRKSQVINLPLAVGFGLSHKDDILFLKGKVDIAIVGTALFKTWQKGGLKKVHSFLQKLIQA